MAAKNPPCKSCGEALVWAEMEPSGKPHPFVALPESPSSEPSEMRGRWAIVKGKAHQYTAEDARLQRERWRSHFWNCPDAERWRSKGAS